MAAEETEITLGTGKLLGLFLMLAATCGIFFGVGYSLGKTSAREQALKNVPGQPEAATLAREGNAPAAAPAPADAASSTSTAAEKDSAPDLTFYKAVKEKAREDTHPTQGAKSAESAAGSSSQSAPPAMQTETPAASPAMTAKAAVPRTTPPAASAQPSPQAGFLGSYLVQIAAVSHEEDAAALASALRKKSYAASVLNNPTGKDKLFHVVLGPYANLQDAEAMKMRLQGEGYSPIVKR